MTLDWLGPWVTDKAGALSEAVHEQTCGNAGRHTGHMIVHDQNKQLAITRGAKKRKSPQKGRGKMGSGNTAAALVMKTLL